MQRGTARRSGVSDLQPDDLLDDRELAAVEDDRLAHEGIVDQLAALARTVPTPSNIALYGPWGSGKSGIANLLEGKIDGRDGVRFVRFDAFKYADVPLRRNFISAIASGLKNKQSKYHSDLYSGRTKTEIKVPPTTVLKLLGFFAVLLLGLAAILAVAVAGVAYVQSRLGANTDFGVEFMSLSKQVVLAGLVPAALLAALIALASKTFTVDRSLARPESDEQFEGIFRDLVIDAGVTRLVVFVDELDRCSASEVVTTLDTIRTFLGIEGCVFIVAADQNVLEEALTRAAKQESPADDTNPYYSTGSAYLDKVFQYQLSLPPLLSQSVSRYAASLVENRGGVWAEINRDYVLSVLIPTHVTSPRRVKHLLNTYALTYRLAQGRHKSGLMAEDPCANAAAIARLVCLRVEFPLFARHLEVDANLPSLVLQLMQDETAELPAGTSDRAFELAKSYALDNAAPSTILLEDELESDGAAEDRAAQVSKAHNKQLLNYLSRTRQVRGPSRDLVYMQSTGTVFGLDGELALAVERAAEDVDVETLRRRVLGIDALAWEGVLQVLTNQIRTGTGVTGPNAARSFLLLTQAEPDLPVSSVADTVSEAICVLQNDTGDILDEDTVASAWALTKVGSEAGAFELRRRVIAASTVRDIAPPDFLFEDSTLALDAAPAAMASYLSSRVVSPDGLATIARLFRLSDDDLVKVMTATSARISGLARDAAQAHDDWTTAHEASPTTAPAAGTRASAAAVATEEESEPEPFGPRVVLDALANAAGERETPIQHLVIGLLLDVETADSRNAAVRLLGRTEPVTDLDLASSILQACKRRVLGDWVNWLKHIAPEAIGESHSESIALLVAKAWEAKGDLTATRSALDALTPLISSLPHGRQPSLTADILDSVGKWVSSTEEATERRDMLQRARSFADARVVDYDRISTSVARSLQDTLAESLSRIDADDDLYRYMVEDGTAAVRACAGELLDSEVRGLLSEAAASPWLDDLGHVVVALELAMAVGRSRIGFSDLPTAPVMAEITANYEESAVHAATLWFELSLPGPDDFAAVYEPLRRARQHTSELANAARNVQKAWTAEQHRTLLDRYLAAADADVPDDAVLDVLGLAWADESQVADLLVGRFSAATNNTQRQWVVTLWKKARIEGDSMRRRLVETIIYGLLDLKIASGNVRAAELALNALASVGNPLPSRVKMVLGDRVRSAVAGTSSLENRALSVLPALGYSTAKGFLGKPKSVRYDA